MSKEFAYSVKGLCRLLQDEGVTSIVIDYEKIVAELLVNYRFIPNANGAADTTIENTIDHIYVHVRAKKMNIKDTLSMLRWLNLLEILWLEDRIPVNGSISPKISLLKRNWSYTKEYATDTLRYLFSGIITNQKYAGRLSEVVLIPEGCITNSTNQMGFVHTGFTSDVTVFSTFGASRYEWLKELKRRGSQGFDIT